MPIVAVLLLAACTARSSPTTLRLCGSNTLGADVAGAMIRAFFFSRGLGVVTSDEWAAPKPGISEEKPALVIHGRIDDQVLDVEIRHGGTKTAFEPLAQNACDIAMASAPVTGAELKLFRPGALFEQVVGLDGIAVIIPRSSAVNWMSVQNLRQVFAGEIRDWRQLLPASSRDKQPRPIALFVRNDKSGTRAEFERLIMAGAPIAPGASPFEDSDQLVDAVSREPNGIGFVGRPFIGATKALDLGDDEKSALYPSNDLIRLEEYPLSRRLFMYRVKDRDPARDPLIAEIVDFAASDAGQVIVARHRFVDLLIQVAPGAPPAPGLYQAATEACQNGCATALPYPPPKQVRLLLDLRFQPASYDLDARATRDITRLRDFLTTKAASTVVTLVGFADNFRPGNQAHPVQSNLALSWRRALAVQQKLTRVRPETAIETLGLGEVNPVQTNATPEGRQANRRVEVWISP